MGVDEMLSRMSSSELTQWMVFYDLEPFGDLRADLRSGMAAAPLINMWAGKGSRKVKPSDFILPIEDKEPMSADDIGRKLMMFTKLSGGVVKGGGT